MLRRPEMGQDERAGLEEFAGWLRHRHMALEHQIPHLRRWVVRFLRLRASRPREVWQDTLKVFLDDLGKGNYKGWQVRQAADAVTLYCGRYCQREVTGTAPVRHTSGRQVAGTMGPDEEASGGICAPRKGRGGKVRAAGQTGDRVRVGGDGDAGPGPGPGGRSESWDPIEPGRDRGDVPTAMAGEPEGAGDQLTHSQMLAEMRRLLRLRHYAPRTERVYMGWGQRFLRYVGRSGERTPRADDVQDFLSHLAIQRKVSASTQNQACNALLFLFRHVLMEDMGDLGATVRASRTSGCTWWGEPGAGYGAGDVGRRRLAARDLGGAVVGPRPGGDASDRGARGMARTAARPASVGALQSGAGR